ncbi:MAG TPA: TonB family protein [Blastocatellia bacterium]|nr:TonB family protein [Blastocatellia bacterium]
MPATRSPLDRIKVASPCTADWRFMLGNELVRFCGQCNKNVYNLSSMKRAEAEDLIRRMEGQLCVKFYRRNDGTILTADCPVGLRAFKQRVSRIKTAIFAVLISFFANIGLLSLFVKEKPLRLPIVGWNMHEFPLRVNSSVGQPVVGKMPPSESMGGARVEPRVAFRSESFLRKQAIRSVPGEFTFSGAGYKERDSVVRVTISDTGDVIDARYVSGMPELETLAIEAARAWKFKPLKVDGLPVWVEGTLTFPVKTPER